MKYTKCERCGKEINSNMKNCSSCVDVILYGSKEKAKKVKLENFKKLGLC